MDSRIATLLLNTSLLAAATCAISLPLGTALACLLARTDIPGRRLGVSVLALLLFVPLYIQAAAWQAGFGIQGWFTLAAQAPVWLDGWIGAVWIHAMAAVPWVALIAGSALCLVETELEQQALLDGSALQVFFHVTLRSTLPAFIVATLWVVIAVTTEMTVTDLFAIRTYAEEVYTNFALGLEPHEAPLALWPGIVLAVALVCAGLLLGARLIPPDRPLSYRNRLVFRLRRWRVPLAVLSALLLLLLLGVPLVNLAYKAGVLVTPTETGLARTWSIEKCLGLVIQSPWRDRRELAWSLVLASLAASAALVLGTSLAWFACRGKRRFTAMMFLVAACLALPGPLLGFALIQLLNRHDVPLLAYLYDRSLLAPWLALVVRSLPLPTLVIWQALRTVPQSALDSAAIDGAGSLRQLVSVALPSRLAPMGLAWLVAFAVALGDLAATVLVLPPDVTTVSLQIFQWLHSGVEDRVASICLALILLFAAVTAMATVLARRWLRPLI